MCGGGESELGQVMLAYTVLFLFSANTFFLNEQVGCKRPDLRTRNYCVRGGSSTERRVEPGE